MTAKSGELGVGSEWSWRVDVGGQRTGSPAWISGLRSWLAVFLLHDNGVSPDVYPVKALAVSRPKGRA